MEPQPGASRPAAEEEEDGGGGGSGGQPEALSLEEILRLYNQPINEEQAWAVCYQCCASLRARARRGETPAGRPGAAAAHLRVWRDGAVTLEQDEPDRPPPPAAGKSGRLHCTEMEVNNLPEVPTGAFLNYSSKYQSFQQAHYKSSKVIESLGIIIYKALDYGLKDNEERELSPPLEQLIDYMTNATETDGSRDEGYDALDEGVEDDHEDDKEEVEAIHSYKDVMKLCAAHLPTRSEAPNHYQAVCRALFAETMELYTFLAKIKSAKENLKKIQEMDKEGSDESSTDLDDLKNADWARFWVQVMRDLRNGVKLKKVQERQYNPLPIEYQLTPYEMLMDDIRSKRYTLRKVMKMMHVEGFSSLVFSAKRCEIRSKEAKEGTTNRVWTVSRVNGDIPPRLKKSAHEIILDFIRSRPPLNPASARKLKPTPPRPRSLHERILEEIKAERKLRPVSPDEIRRSRLAIRPLSMSYSFDLSDVPTPEAGRKAVDASVVNGGPAPQGKQNGATQVTVQRKRLLKAPTLAELDSSDSEEESVHKSGSSSSISPSQVEDPSQEGTSSRKMPPKFLPISSTPQPERRQPPQRRHSIEKETPTNVRQFLPPSKQSSRSLEEFCYPVECLALTVEEVMHIRQVLVKAELEKYQQYKDVYTALKKGKMRLPSKPYSTLPIFSLGPSTLQRGESFMRPEKPSTSHHHSLRSRLTSRSKSVDKSHEEFPKELMEDWSTMEVCVDCKKFISEIINSSRRSLSLANKRARLKRKTQSFYMSSPGTSEYCPSERTINEI
ncbi:Protein spire 1 [Pitangus sulphuratus]|nr:Protein spire 1 [Pitangus sulphuratus]